MYCNLSRDVLLSLRPQYIRMYLKGKGWTKSFSKNGYYDVYLDKENSIEVIVPVSSSFSDYVVKMKLLLETLSDVEKRSMIDIVSDISLVNSANSIQYRIKDGCSDGTISASIFKDIIDAHKTISATAYMDMIEPMFYHKACNKGYSALKSMRVGQTSYGSYIIKFIYPYISTNQECLDGSACGDDPYIKMVADKIVSSSQKVIIAAEEEDILDEKQKISYNFVDSLVGLEIDDKNTSIEMSKITFKASEEHESPIEFNSHIFPRIAYIADQLKPKELKEVRTYQGWVSNIGKEDQDSDQQKIRLTCFDDGKIMNVSILLSGSDMQKAHESMISNKMISLDGVLSGYSRKKTIEEINNFRIIL